MCVWVRDLHVPLCTLATGRGVHITSTGKGHTKHKAKKQNINKDDKISCVCVAAKTTLVLKQTSKQGRQNFLCVCVFVSSSVCWFAAPLLLCCCCLIFVFIFIIFVFAFIFA